jgi:hypothetical protein
MILRKDKNRLLTIIQESGIAPSLFESQNKSIDKEEYFVISLRDSPVSFAISPCHGDFNSFFCRRSQFMANFPLDGRQYVSNTIHLTTLFNTWLTSVVKPYLENISTPDFWQILEETRSYTKSELGMPKDFEQFSSEEKIPIRLSLNEFKLLIVKNFNPNKEELAIIDARLKYLSDALDKHNKFDWKGIAISTVISITIALSLSPEQGNQLFNLFKQVFSNVLYLLGSA